jgi:hypothetical protein
MLLTHRLVWLSIIDSFQTLCLVSPPEALQIFNDLRGSALTRLAWTPSLVYEALRMRSLRPLWSREPVANLGGQYIEEQILEILKRAEPRRPRTGR